MSKCKHPSECIDSNSCALMHECAMDGPRLTDRVQVGSTVYEKGTLAELAIDAIKRALLSASKPAAPHQPTEAMLNAARDWSVKKYGQGIGNDAAIGCWQAMLAASPAAPAKAGDLVPNGRLGLRRKDDRDAPSAVQDDERADAERYRKLRSGNDYEKDGPMVVMYEAEADNGERPYWVLAGEVLDAAVDARAASPQATTTQPAQTNDARDAARYRWLRQQHWNEAEMFVVAGSKSQVRLGADCPSLVRLDEAIDTALAKQQVQEG